MRDEEGLYTICSLNYKTILGNDYEGESIGFMNSNDLLYGKPNKSTIKVYDEKTGEFIMQNRTMMDDEFLYDSVDPDGTVNSNNVVTAIVFDYRGFDTLGEATVLFAAVTGVLTTIRIAFPGKKGNKGGDLK